MEIFYKQSYFSVILMIAVALLNAGFSSAQDKIIRCGNPDLEEIEIKDTAQYKTIMKYEKWIGRSTAAKIPIPDTITIPMVVHIIYGHPDSVENISDAQVMSQMEVLNEDFLKISGTAGDGGGVNTKIQFCLATRDPFGKPTSGINRIQSALTVLNWSTQEDALKAIIHWPPDQYLNVWVVKSMGAILGVGKFPWTEEKKDGVVLVHYSFGRTGSVTAPYNKGATLTHEIGHWLGLYHTFQGGCPAFQIDSSNCKTTGDFICDTPPDLQLDGICADTNTCAMDFPNLTDPTHNYMEYYHDTCLNEFTAGQSVRMHIVMDSVGSRRQNIWQISNLAAVGCSCLGNNDLVDEDWNRIYKTPDSKFGTLSAMATDRKGNVFITGSSTFDNSFVQCKEYSVVKFDSTGILNNQILYNNFGSPCVTNGGNNWATAVFVDPFSNLYVTGQSLIDSSFEDIHTIKYDKAGNVLWVAKFDGVDSNEDYPAAIRADIQGNVYVAGFTNYASRSNYLLLKYGPVGQELWRAIYEGNDSLADHINALELDPSGNIYVTGYSQEAGQKLNITTIKYNPVGGVIWMQSWNDSLNQSETAYSLALDDSGNVYISGRTDIDPSSSFQYAGLILKYNNVGVFQWYRTDPTIGYGRSVKTDNYGNIVYGGDNTYTSSSDFVIVKYDRNGNFLWRDTINGPGNYGDFFKALDIDCSDNIYVTGQTTGGSSGNGIMTAKIYAMGYIAWRQYFYGTDAGEEKAVGIEAGEDGNVYVTGNSFSNDSLNWQYACLRYKQDMDSPPARIGSSKKDNYALKIFPVPASEIINISSEFSSGNNWVLSLADNTGKVRQLHRFNNQMAIKFDLEVKDLEPGLYYIMLQNETRLISGKFIVMK